MEYRIFTIRTNNKVAFYFVFFVVVFSLCFVTIAMFLVYMAVRKVEKDALKYTFATYTSSKKQKLKISRRIMIQGILYSAVLASLCLTYIFKALIPGLDFSFSVEVVASIMIPLQGLWNGLIYMMPLFQQIIKKKCNS